MNRKFAGVLWSSVETIENMNSQAIRDVIVEIQVLNIAALFPEIDQLRGLPPEEVAGALSKALSDEQLRNTRGTFHPKNEANGPFDSPACPYPPEPGKNAKRILMEATNWLQCGGLICEEPS
jgi:hypothetical protein